MKMATQHHQQQATASTLARRRCTLDSALVSAKTALESPSFSSSKSSPLRLTTSLHHHRHHRHQPRRPSDDSLTSSSFDTSPTTPGSVLSSPPSSLGHHAHHDTLNKSSSSSTIHRRVSFVLPARPISPPARPRLRAYSDKGPSPAVYSYSPPQTSSPLNSPHSSLPSSSASWPSHFSTLTRPSASFISARGISNNSHTAPPSIKRRLLQVAAHDDANYHYTTLQGRPELPPSSSPSSSSSSPRHGKQLRSILSGTRQRLPSRTAAQSPAPHDPQSASNHQQHSWCRLSPNALLPANATPIPPRLLPIRSFRSSGSRKSLHIPDMNFTPRPYDLHQSTADSGIIYHDDPARSTTNASFDHHARFMTPPVSAHQDLNGDESGDVFLRIAKEDVLTRTATVSPLESIHSPSPAPTHRSWHRRPLSTSSVTYQPLSPPKLRRRLSDQQQQYPVLENAQDEHNQTSRFLQHRSLGRGEKAASAHPGGPSSQFSAATRPHRPPPLTTRSTLYHDNADSYRNARRRSSVTDSTPPLSGRGHSYKTAGAYNYSKTYSSSPLVRNFELPPSQPQDVQNTIESPGSTASTTAPSTVWDELDELKSRINRLEVKGKMPSTSAAAVAKLSDERPVTANTQLTGASSSPKRQVHVDQGAVPTQRQVHTILQDALAKCKGNFNSQVFSALECVAQDAMALASAVSNGPMSNGTSTIGGAGSTTADRQLRRKAEGVCRGLTELCIALNDDATTRLAESHKQTTPTYATSPSTPMLSSFHGSGSGGGGGGSSSSLAASRRHSIVESSMSLSHISPRSSVSKYQERRNSILHGAGPPVSLHSTPGDSGISRLSPLLVSRTRQARTEEVDDGRESCLLRDYKMVTEDGEDGPRSRYLLRSYRDTNDETMSTMSTLPPLSRSPTRRILKHFEPAKDAEVPDRLETASVVSSAMSRRRLATDAHGCRLVSSPALSTRYLERSASMRDGMGTPTMDRLGRQVSMQSRGGNSQPRSREGISLIPRPPSRNENATLEALPR